MSIEEPQQKGNIRSTRKPADFHLKTIEVVHTAEAPPQAKPKTRLEQMQDMMEQMQIEELEEQRLNQFEQKMRAKTQMMQFEFEKQQLELEKARLELEQQKAETKQKLENLKQQQERPVAQQKEDDSASTAISTNNQWISPEILSRIPPDHFQEYVRMAMFASTMGATPGGNPLVATMLMQMYGANDNSKKDRDEDPNLKAILEEIRKQSGNDPMKMMNQLLDFESKWRERERAMRPIELPKEQDQWSLKNVLDRKVEEVAERAFDYILNPKVTPPGGDEGEKDLMFDETTAMWIPKKVSYDQYVEIENRRADRLAEMDRAEVENKRMKTIGEMVKPFTERLAPLVEQAAADAISTVKTRKPAAPTLSKRQQQTQNNNDAPPPPGVVMPEDLKAAAAAEMIKCTGCGNDFIVEPDPGTGRWPDSVKCTYCGKSYSQTGEAPPQ